MTVRKTARWKWRARRSLQEEAEGKVLILTKPNAGKAEALNYGLEHLTDEEIFVGIDADTIIAPDAISRLVPHFLNPKVGADRRQRQSRQPRESLDALAGAGIHHQPELRAARAEHAGRGQRGAGRDWRVASFRSAGGGRLPHRHGGRRCRSHHGAAAARISRRVRRSGAGLHRSSHQRERPDAPALPLVVRNSAGGVEASRSFRAQGRAGLGRAAEHPHLPDSAAPGFAIHRPDVRRSASIWYYMQKYFHPESTDPASFQHLVVFFVAFLVIDFIASAIAFALERRQPDAKEDVWLLSQVWLQRFAYRQLFSIVLLKTLKRAARRAEVCLGQAGADRGRESAGGAAGIGEGTVRLIHCCWRGRHALATAGKMPTPRLEIGRQDSLRSALT